jgi:hypothetical protein
MNTAGSTDTIAENLSQNQNFNKIIDKKINDSYAGIVVHNRGANVIKKEINLNSINVYPDYIRINLVSGNSAWVSVNYIPSNVSDNQKGVTWSVSDGLVAEIDADGVITALSEGECLITATSSYNAKFQANALLEVVSAALISVPAPFRWVAEDNVKSIYTGNDEPQSGEYIWAAEVNDVEIMPGVPEEESYAAAAYGTVFSVDRRDYIVTPDGLIYWRDKSKYGIYNYEALRLCPANIVGALRVPVDGNNNDVFVFVENLRSDGAETTGRVFRNVLMEEPPDDVSIETVMQYSVDNCLVAENIPYEEDIEVLVSKIGMLYIHMPYQGNRKQTVALLSAESPECPGVPLQEYEYDALYATGETVTLTGKTNMDDTFTYTYHEAYTFDKKFTLWVSAESAGYTFPALPGKPYLERVVEDQGTEYEHSYDVVKPDAAFPDPDYWTGFRHYFVCEAGRPTNTQWSFVFENTGYAVRDDGWWDTHWCYVFDVKPCYAWSLSPCFQDRLDVPQTIYTNDIKNPVIGDAYGSWNAETKQFTPTGTIAGNGEGVYSITSADNETFYSTLQMEAPGE